MRQSLVLQALVIITVAVSGLMIIYNMSLPKSYPLSIAYSYPVVRTEEPEIIADENENSDAKEESENLSGEESDDGSFAQDEDELFSVTFPLDINAATVQQLEFIPQVGNTTAQRIIQYRGVLGGYTSLEQLMEIKGIGQSTYEKISAYLTVAGEQ